MSFIWLLLVVYDGDLCSTAFKLTFHFWGESTFIIQLWNISLYRDRNDNFQLHALRSIIRYGRILSFSTCSNMEFLLSHLVCFSTGTIWLSVLKSIIYVFFNPALLSEIFIDMTRTILYQFGRLFHNIALDLTKFADLSDQSQFSAGLLLVWILAIICDSHSSTSILSWWCFVWCF